MRPPRIVRSPWLVARSTTKPMAMPASAATRRRRSRRAMGEPPPSVREYDPVGIAIRHRPSRLLELRHRRRYRRQIRAADVEAGKHLVGAAAVLEANLLENQRRWIRILPSVKVDLPLGHEPQQVASLIVAVVQVIGALSQRRDSPLRDGIPPQL